jgi:hypothetical protein
MTHFFLISQLPAGHHRPYSEYDQPAQQLTSLDDWMKEELSVRSVGYVACSLPRYVGSSDRQTPDRVRPVGAETEEAQIQRV